jgi:hypothetical protein
MTVPAPLKHLDDDDVSRLQRRLIDMLSDGEPHFEIALAADLLRHVPPERAVRTVGNRVRVTKTLSEQVHIGTAALAHAALLTLEERGEVQREDIDGKPGWRRLARQPGRTVRDFDWMAAPDCQEALRDALKRLPPRIPLPEVYAVLHAAKCRQRADERARAVRGNSRQWIAERVRVRRDLSALERRILRVYDAADGRRRFALTVLVSCL